jgi:ribosomal protein L37AE/L43A
MWINADRHVEGATLSIANREILATLEAENNKEDAMMTTCAKCCEALIAPDWSEFVSERLVINLWSCTKCGDCFETVARMPADVAPKMSEKDWEAMFPPPLVA